MKPAARNLTRRFALLVIAAALITPPSMASELIALRPLAGLPNIGISDGQEVAWRRVGIVAESELIDVQATISTRLASLPGTPLALGVNSACAEAACETAGTELGRHLGLTFKIPRWHPEAPLIDVVLRRWTAQSTLAPDGEPSTGTAAGLEFTQPAGPLDALLGFSTPIRAGNESRWTSGFAGLAWHAGRGTTFEFVVERSVEARSGVVDRMLTMRIFHAMPSRGTRLVAWTTRSLDNRSDALRAGAGIDLSF